MSSLCLSAVLLTRRGLCGLYLLFHHCTVRFSGHGLQGVVHAPQLTTVAAEQVLWHSCSSGGSFMMVWLRLQVLPFASDETLSQLEANIAGLPAVTDVMAMGMTLERLTEVLLEGIGVDGQHVSSITPKYGPCDKEGLQVTSSLVSVHESLALKHCSQA